MTDSKVLLPKLSQNWVDAKKFNAQRVRRRLKVDNGDLSSKENYNHNMNTVFHLQSGDSRLTFTRPAIAVSVTMSEDEDEQNDQERSVSDADTTDVSAWAMMENYDWSRDSASKRSDSSSRKAEIQSFQISEIGEDAGTLDVTVPQTQHLTTSIIEWQENDNGELIEPSIHDDSSTNESVIFCHTENASSSGQIVPCNGLTMDKSTISLKQETSECNSKVDISRTTAKRVREERDSPALPEQRSFAPDDSTSNSSLHHDDVQNSDESTTSISDDKISASTAVIKQHNEEIVDSPRSFYMSTIAELENDLREQKTSTAAVQSKLKDRVEELEQTLRVTAATPRGTVIQQNPLKTLLDRNQTLVKEVRFADQTCVELSSRVMSLEQENKALLERVERLEWENASLRLERQQQTEDYETDVKNKSRQEVSFPRLDGKPLSTVAKMESSISVSTNIYSMEMSRLCEENNSLGHQLVSMQKQLDAKAQEQEEAHKVPLLYEDPLVEGVQSIKSDGSRMVEDGREFQLVSFAQEAHREKAIVASLRKQLDGLQTMQQDNAELSDEQVNFEVMNLVSSVLNEIHQRYASLEVRVSTTVDGYISRLEDLTKKVEVLKSSLLFEAEPQPIRIKSRYNKPPAGESKDRGENFVSTPSTKEDDMLELMEEARIPTDSHIEFNDDDSWINFQDISHSVIDDDTLGSVMKNRSMATDEGHTRWKEQLEAILTECNRVKKRSTELREEINRQKSTIEALEGENGKLSLQSSRKGEEIHMVEQALLEARKVIAELEQKLLEAKNENYDAMKSAREKDENILSIQKSVQRAESDCAMEHTKRQILEKRVSEMEACLAEKAKMLDEATQLSSMLKVKNVELSKDLTKTQEEAQESMKNSLSDLQLSLKQANEYIEDLKIKRQEAIAELSEAVVCNTSQKKQIDKLQADKKKNASDIEDSVLESQYSLEAMRRERAELRSKLSKRESELNGLKEMFTNYKATSQIQHEKRLKLIQSLQAEKFEVLLHCENLQIMRQNFVGLIESTDLCENLAFEIVSNQSKGCKDDKSSSLENEILLWRQILQHVEGTLRSIPRRNKDFTEAVEQLELLSNDMTVVEKSKNECKKTLAEEREQNKKLCSLLGQAEFEMERSALQIQEMSAVLSHLQQNEAELNERIGVSEKEYSSCSEQLVLLQEEVSNERKETEKKKNELGETLKEQELQLLETTAELSATKRELEKMTDYQQSQATMIASQEDKLMASESKCTRLRVYIQKLTKKCEEWEKSYDHQFKCIEKLRRKNSKVLDKASEITRKYQKLKTDVQRKRICHNSDREKWSNERSNIQAVHMELEEELDLIAKELNTS